MEGCHSFIILDWARPLKDDMVSGKKCCLIKVIHYFTAIMHPQYCFIWRPERKSEIITKPHYLGPQMCWKSKHKLFASVDLYSAEASDGETLTTGAVVRLCGSFEGTFFFFFLALSTTWATHHIDQINQIPRGYPCIYISLWLPHLFDVYPVSSASRLLWFSRYQNMLPASLQTHILRTGSLLWINHEKADGIEHLE